MDLLNRRQQTHPKHKDEDEAKAFAREKLLAKQRKV